MDERRIRRKNVFKVVRTVFETVVMLAALYWVIHTLRASPNGMREDGQWILASAEDEMISGETVLAGQTPAVQADDHRFIAISYNGLVIQKKKDGKIVSKQAFDEQMQALKASGYQTISQQDVLNYYESGAALPEKALLLIFEDGIYDTTVIAQPSLVANNYIATMCDYAENLSDVENLYITADNMKKLLANSYWEMGSNGYRLSYINIFDRYENYFGHLSLAEFLRVHDYLKRDYNHYLMDFLRDEYRLRQESVEEMEKRIAWDYEKSEELYQAALGYVPSLYILMHSNTGAYGNDPLVSRKNEEMMQKVFGMNFNRQGSCLNTLDASVYDLTRLQCRQYFSTNHLMMRIWDDTGDPVMFRLGNSAEAARWNRLQGAVEFSDHRIILTTLPYGSGTLVCSKRLPSDYEVTVTLMGNQVGQQKICLNADTAGEGGITVNLHNHVLYISDAGAAEPLLALDLFEFDGGPYVSVQEDELAGKIALNQAILELDEDESRRAEAETTLRTLEQLRVPGLDDGAQPYVPNLDIDDEDERHLRIRVAGSRLSCWLDDILIADHIQISGGNGNCLALSASVTEDNERFSQTNLSDDVYDGIFKNLRVYETNGHELYSYAEAVAPEIADLPGIRGYFVRLYRDFVEFFSGLH